VRDAGLEEALHLWISPPSGLRGSHGCTPRALPRDRSAVGLYQLSEHRSGFAAANPPAQGFASEAENGVGPAFDRRSDGRKRHPAGRHANKPARRAQFARRSTGYGPSGKPAPTKLMTTSATVTRKI
jgi:hypothetical protein